MQPILDLNSQVFFIITFPNGDEAFEPPLCLLHRCVIVIDLCAACYLVIPLPSAATFVITGQPAELLWPNAPQLYHIKLGSAHVLWPHAPAVGVLCRGQVSLLL